MMKTTLLTGAFILLLMTGISPGWAAVSEEEAAQLKSTLTPMGGERAGNEDGTIPAWDGGYTKVDPGWKNGDPRPDPFADEKPLYSITSQNMEQYADKLSDGDKLMLQKYPTYRMDVYPSHRTAAAPQWVYDNTYKNALNAKLINNGLTLEGAYGGKPFPIAKTGIEHVWNHILQWGGEAVFYKFKSHVVTSNGAIVLATAADQTIQYPYHLEDGEKTWNGDHWWHYQLATAPSFKAGESLLIIDNTDFYNKPRMAWQYLPGQRRVRKSPTVGFDTPDFVVSGIGNFDEAFVWLGSPERYDWKIVEKKEMYVMYNNNRITLSTPEEALKKSHLNPDLVRWELHRVWVVDATVAEGKRHVVPKRRSYFDEDTGVMLMADLWDAAGTLWKHDFGLTVLAPDIPALLDNVSFGVYNFDSGAYVLNLNIIGSKVPYKTIKPLPPVFFSPDRMAGAGIR